MPKVQTGQLKHGLFHKDQPQREFEMRGVQTAGELFEAEIESGGVHNQLAFNGALMARQLVRVGECTGPFSIEQIRALSPADFSILRTAQMNLDKAENPNGESSDSESGK